MTTSKSDF